MSLKIGKFGNTLERWTEEYQEDTLESSLIIGDTIQHGFVIL